MDILSLITIFILSCFIGFYVIWSVTPALHSPLMAITNAISSVIIIGSIIAVSYNSNNVSIYFAFIATLLAAVNIFGGLTITYRMVKMFQKKKKISNK